MLLGCVSNETLPFCSHCSIHHILFLQLLNLFIIHLCYSIVFATVKFEVCYWREAVLGNYPFISPALVYPFLPSLSLILLTAAMGGSVLGNDKDNAGGILEIELTGVGYIAECFFFLGRSALTNSSSHASGVTPGEAGFQIVLVWWLSWCQLLVWIPFVLKAHDTCWNNAEKSKTGRGSFSILPFASQASALDLCPLNYAMGIQKVWCEFESAV